MAHTSIRIDECARLALVEVGGAVTAADIIEAAHALHAHPQWDFRFSVVWDGRTITSLAVTPGDMPKMVEAKLEDSIGQEITVVVRELDQMIANLCALLLRARGRDAKVVATLDEALAELDLDRLPAPLEGGIG